MGLIIKWAESGAAKSGVALRIESVELLESREDDVPKWNLSDNKLYEIERIIAEKTEGFGTLPENRMINYSEIEFPVTPDERTARDLAAIAMGLTTPAKILMRDNPDGFDDLAAAQTEIDANKAANEVAGQSGRSAFTRIGVQNGQ